MGAKGDYLLASLVRKTSHELKIFLRISFEPYFIPREPSNSNNNPIQKRDGLEIVTSIMILIGLFEMDI